MGCCIRWGVRRPWEGAIDGGRGAVFIFLRRGRGALRCCSTTILSFPQTVPPQAVHPLVAAEDGSWSVDVPGLIAGQAYAFRVDGPSGNAEGFDPETPVGDPWALAVAHAENHSLLVDPEAETEWFAGWTDQGFNTPAAEDLVIYETHVRDLTADDSSPVPQALKGTYQGVLASEGTGTGLDHIKAMGYNAIEFMPVQEFTNGTNRYDWGYGPSFYFAPEASYARDPMNGSQYYEFKHLVNELHARGFAVIIDVVYNHLGTGQRTQFGGQEILLPARS